MNKWLQEAKLLLADVLEKAEDGAIPPQNLYMLAPILYSEKSNAGNEELIEEMIEVNDEQVARDWALDENKKYQYRFYYISSYLYCFVVTGIIDEMKYDKIMEYVCSEIDLFTDDYGSDQSA